MSRHVDILRRAHLDRELFGRTVIPAVRFGSAAAQQFARKNSTDCWQQLTYELFLRRDPAGHPAIGLASATAGEGTSFVAGHLAAELARSTEQSTLLLEANVYRSTQAQQHGVEPEPGLRHVLGDREFSLEGALRQTGIKSLWLLPGGAQGNGAGPDWTFFPRVLARLRERFANLVIDLPPVNFSSDAMIIGPWLDGLVLIVEADLCSREVIQSAAERLRRANPSLLGAILNKRKFVIPEAIYRRL